MSMRAATAVLFASLLTSACVVVPVTAEGYDPQCGVTTHHVALQTVQLSAMYNCEHAGGEAHVCAAMVLTSAGVLAASAIVSGSIMVVGNVAYWAEERAGCLARASAPS